MCTSIARRCYLSFLAAAAALIVAPPGGTFSVSAQTVQLRLVSTAWSPFTNGLGQPRFALDLVEEGLKRIRVSSTTSIVEPAQFTQALLSDTFDGSAAVWRDAEREKVLLFSQSYLENRLVLVGRKGADVSATNMSALKGKRIAIVEGYAYGDIDNAGPTFVRLRNDEASLTELLRAGVDYALIDELVVEYIVSNHSKESQTRLEIGKTPLVVRQLFFAVRRTRPDAETIIKNFNAQLRGMIVDRTYHRLLHVGWIRADIDGDGVPEYIPASDKAGPTAPQHVYSLFSSEPTASQPASKTIEISPRFYLGGSIYTDWATVPDPFKVHDSQSPDPNRSTATIFKFVW
jgi:polar amino acid transport system substrate-binding protein